MPNFELLLDNNAQIIKSKENEVKFFSTFHLRYAYPQNPLDAETKRHFNFGLIGGHATGTYQFQTE